jgi:hypothetical protein
MRPDQITRIQELSEAIADQFIVEADPREWPGAGTPPAEWSTEERGNSYWAKKNAMATAGVLRFTLDITKAAGVNEGVNDVEREADLDKQISEAERRAKAALQKVLARVR